MLNKLKENTFVRKGVLLLIAFMIVCMVFINNRRNSVEESKRFFEVNQKSAYLFLSNAENSLIAEAKAIVNNLSVKADGVKIGFDEPVFINNTAIFTNDEYSVKVEVSGLLSDNDYRDFIVYDLIDKQTESGQMNIRYTSEVDEELKENASNQGYDVESTEVKGHYIKEEAHASVVREVEGVVDNFVIDGVADEMISGTVAGEQVIEEDPYLHRDRDESIDKESELEQQHVEVVEKPVQPAPEQPQANEPQPTPENTVAPAPETPVVTEPTVEEGEIVVETEESQPASNPITTEYSALYIVDENMEAIATYFGNGSQTVMASESEANVVDNGDGTVSTSFGIFSK